MHFSGHLLQQLLVPAFPFRLGAVHCYRDSLKESFQTSVEAVQIESYTIKMMLIG